MRATTPTSPHRNRPSLRRGARVALLALALLFAGALPGTALLASTAYAGQWIQVACATPSGSDAGSEGWSSSLTIATPGSGLDNFTDCTATNPMYAAFEPIADTNAPAGSAETLEYTPPAGSTLDGGTIDINMYTGGFDGDELSGTAGVYTPADSADSTDIVLQCNFAIYTCNKSPGNSFSGVLTLPADRGGNLYLTASCTGPSGQNCNLLGGGPWALVQLKYANLLLDNSSVPAATGFAGTLLTPDAHGTADVFFNAADPGGPGIYQVTVDIDGNPVYQGTPDSNQGDCAPLGLLAPGAPLVFDSQQPCPQAESIDLPIDTTTLADGQHNLKVILTDAAQNTTTVLDQTITTLNHPAASASANVPAPAKAAATSQATPPAASAAPAVYALSLDPALRSLTRGITRPFSQSAVKLSGSVTTNAGAPAAGLPVTLWTHLAGSRGYQEAAHSTTNAMGTWTLIAPGGPSRVLRVEIGQAPQPADPAGAIIVKETVTPTLSLRVATPGNATLIFSGQLAIKPLGKPRPLVLIETPGPDGWETVGIPIRVDPHGGFRYAYRTSPLTLHRRFAFRAATPATALWNEADSAVRTAVAR
jgi:hypothetical protein